MFWRTADKLRKSVGSTNVTHYLSHKRRIGAAFYPPVSHNSVRTELSHLRGRSTDDF